MAYVDEEVKATDAEDFRTLTKCASHVPEIAEVVAFGIKRQGTFAFFYHQQKLTMTVFWAAFGAIRE
jgi:hypothetical protein